MKTQEQYNQQYSELCTKLGHAIASEEQAKEEQYNLKGEISQLKYELNVQVQEEKKAADAKAKADAVKDVIPLQEVQ